MLTPALRLRPRTAQALRRLALVIASLALAALACARADTPITPAAPQVSTPLPPAPTRTPEASETPTEAPPTSEATATVEAYPGPATETPGGEAISTEGPTLEPSPTVEALATASPSPQALATETPTEATPPGGGFPPNATLTQNFGIRSEAGLLFGRPEDMLDGQTGTWASLRAGNSLWIFDLGTAQNVAGLRLYAHADGGEAVTLTQVEVSTDGTTWTTVYTGSGDCGAPNCDTLPPETNTDIAFNAVSAQFVRMRAGPAPARFAFAEVSIAVVP